MSEELKPCPFCGGAARIESNRDWHRLYADHDDNCVFAADDHMLMYPAQSEYLIQIAEDWNRRVTPFTIPASDAGELPPLPDGRFHTLNGQYFSADQMRVYARSASTRTASDTRTAAESDCDCGCNDPVATDAIGMIEFLAYRFEHAGVSELVAKKYARDCRAILAAQASAAGEANVMPILADAAILAQQAKGEKK